MNKLRQEIGRFLDLRSDIRENIHPKAYEVLETCLDDKNPKFVTT